MHPPTLSLPPHPPDSAPHLRYPILIKIKPSRSVTLPPTPGKKEIPRELTRPETIPRPLPTRPPVSYFGDHARIIWRVLLENTINGEQGGWRWKGKNWPQLFFVGLRNPTIHWPSLGFSEELECLKVWQKEGSY